jgi:hypothetical protein
VRQQLQAALGRLEAAQREVDWVEIVREAAEQDREADGVPQLLAQLAALLQQWWQRPEQVAADRLELAQAAATRSCAYLRCANLGGQGGPAAGQGAGSKKCRVCRTYYCGEACSHADWAAGGHRRVCKALAAARQQREQEQQQVQE